jgi:3-deoxy-D-manno-octulosonate 8-phosphate phosphatase (KDO 8-P phosphatase)
MITLKEKAKKIKMFLVDVDGVLTDGKVIYDSSGNELKSFNIKDGLGITLLHKVGIKTGIITGRNSPMVEKRASELKINEVFQGKKEKLDSYEYIKKKYILKDEEILYIGDDLIDIPILKKVGFPVAVADAAKIVKKYCIYITKAKGGEGAVRETIDYLLTLRGEYNKAVEGFLNG